MKTFNFLKNKFYFGEGAWGFIAETPISSERQEWRNSLKDLFQESYGLTPCEAEDVLSAYLNYVNTCTKVISNAKYRDEGVLQDNQPEEGV